MIFLLERAIKVCGWLIFVCVVVFLGHVCRPSLNGYDKHYVDICWVLFTLAISFQHLFQREMSWCASLSLFYVIPQSSLMPCQSHYNYRMYEPLYLRRKSICAIFNLSCMVSSRDLLFTWKLFVYFTFLSLVQLYRRSTSEW